VGAVGTGRRRLDGLFSLRELPLSWVGRKPAICCGLWDVGKGAIRLPPIAPYEGSGGCERELFLGSNVRMR